MDNIRRDIFLAEIKIIGINPFIYLLNNVLKSIFVQANKEKVEVKIKIDGH
jgi:hypothetical protein